MGKAMQIDKFLYEDLEIYLKIRAIMILLLPKVRVKYG